VSVRAAALCSLVALLGLPESASADLRTVRIERPACASVPFAHERLVELVAVELSVHRVALVDGPADAVVRYDAVDCVAGPRLALEVQHADDPPTRFEVRGLDARALALLLAELLRAAPESASPSATDGPPSAAPGEAPAIPADPPPELPTAQSVPPEAMALVETTDPAGAPVGAPAGAPVEAPAAHASLARALGAPASLEPPSVPRSFDDVSLAVASLATGLQYYPGSRGWLALLRAEGGLRMPFWRPLSVRLDLTYGQGRSEWAIHLGAFGVGVWIAFAIGGPDLALELGPRVALMGGWAFEVPHREILRGNDFLLQASGLVRGVVRVHGAASVLVDLELGATVAGGIDFFSSDPSNSHGGGLNGLHLTVRSGIQLD
jgi:hypothetical protein